MEKSGSKAGSRARSRREEAVENRLLGAALDHAIFTMDAAGIIDFWSAGAAKVLGWPADEILGRDVAITFTPEDREAGEPEKERILARAEGCAPDVRWHQCRDGHRVFLDGTTRPMRDTEGQITGFVKIGQDVTGRHAADVELRESEAGLRTLAETLEHRVRERTAALADTNRALLAEIRDREAAEDQRRLLIRMLIAAEEKERGRLSRELHDRLGQQLTGLLLGLRLLGRDVEPGDRAERLRLLADMAATLSRDLHTVAVQLRPPALDNLGLERALRSHMEEWSERTGIAVLFETTDFDEATISTEIEAALYRIVQEAVNNVEKHAKARHVTITLAQIDDVVTARIEDDGVGFDPSVRSLTFGRRIGHAGMRDRLALLGGRLEIGSEPGKGTVILVHVPTASEPLPAPFDGTEEDA